MAFDLGWSFPAFDKVLCMNCGKEREIIYFARDGGGPMLIDSC